MDASLGGKRPLLGVVSLHLEILEGDRGGRQGRAVKEGGKFVSIKEKKKKRNSAVKLPRVRTLLP